MILSEVSPLIGPAHWWFAEYMPKGAGDKVPPYYDVLLEDRSIIEVHYAFGGGEDQPSFRGWFMNAGSYFEEVNKKTFVYYRRNSR